MPAPSARASTRRSLGSTPRQKTLTRGWRCSRDRTRSLRPPSAHRRNSHSYRSRDTTPRRDSGCGECRGGRTQRVHQSDRARPHGEDVADDPPHAGGRPLVRFNRRRVVVALDAQGHGQIPTDVDHARALARPHQHPRRFGGESAQVFAGRLVGTVFRPHHRVHGQLEVGRGPPEQLFDGLQLVVGHTQQAMSRLHGDGAYRGERKGAIAEQFVFNPVPALDYLARPLQDVCYISSEKR